MRADVHDDADPEPSARGLLSVAAPADSLRLNLFALLVASAAPEFSFACVSYVMLRKMPLHEHSSCEGSSLLRLALFGAFRPLYTSCWLCARCANND